jgi:DNA-binding transcriptional MerR regulator
VSAATTFDSATATTADTADLLDAGPAPPTTSDEGCGTSVATGTGVTLTIAEVAETTGLTAHTLRYYERIGLLTVPRDAIGRRVYTDDEVNRVVFITRLRLTAMPIRDIQAYFRLVEGGPGNEDQRLALLEAHRDRVKAHITELESALGVVEFKIATYGGFCEP